LLADKSFDVLVCDFLPPAVNLPRRLPCPSVLFTHNVESEIWRRHAETRTNPVARALYEQQYARMLRFERRALAKFDRVLVVSAADRDTFARIYPGAIRDVAAVIPTGVDSEFFSPSPTPSAPDARSIVFTGSMDWLPNEDAMLFFCRDVLPAIRAAEPAASLTIVGRAPTPAVRQLASQQGVAVTGRVDDVRPYLDAAAAFVVPLRVGGGTRLKIFEAMSMGKAVVSTTIGAEGLDVTPGSHLLVADEPGAFAQAVVSVLRDVPLRRHLEQAGRSLVVQQYDWSAVAGSLEHALTGAAARSARATSPVVLGALVDH
jgi:sugar transferase (PEP-CTERM/EpsH1 system associated)